MVMQAITMNEHRFDTYRKQSDWIQRRIFPGAQLASIREILNSLVRSTRLSLYGVEDIGLHYAYTLAEWRHRFRESIAEVRALGFDEAFCRMWDYYLAYCEGAFRERHISDVQLMLTKNANPAILFGEPWKQSGESKLLATRGLSFGLAETGGRQRVGV
jgi:cyclopropane-fatty-acyl-phospholipid synthase